MSAGRFDTPCLFWESTFTQNAYGEPIYSWQVAINSPLWCRPEPLKGWERFAGQQVVAQAECKVVVRRWADIDPTHEIEFRGERWQIVSVEDHGRANFQVVWVKRKV